MSERKLLTALIAVLVVGSAGVAGAASSGTTGQASGSAYAGSHVSVNVTDDALVDYRVDGTTVAESVTVQSKRSVESNLGLSVGADAVAAADIAGAALAMDARSETSASVTTDGGAEMTAHDNEHGSLVVAAGNESQYVGLDLSSSASVESERDERVVVTTDAGTESTILVAGNGSVSASGDGNVTAQIDAESRLVVRTYDDRDEDAKQQEELIVDGTAAAQVYLSGQADGDSEAAVDVVDYGQNTSVEVTQRTEGTVDMTVERSKSQGKVVITSVSETTFSSADDVQVRVDGEAAVEASSYSELAAAADGGDTSKFMVTQSASADASADVAVALNHFSQRSVTLTDDSASETSGSDGDTSDTSDSSDDSGGTDSTDTTDSSDTDDSSETTDTSDTTATASSSGDTDDSAGSDSESSQDATATPGQNGPGFTGVMALVAVAAGLGVAGWRER